MFSGLSWQSWVPDLSVLGLGPLLVGNVLRPAQMCTAASRSNGRSGVEMREEAGRSSATEDCGSMVVREFEWVCVRLKQRVNAHQLPDVRS